MQIVGHIWLADRIRLFVHYTIWLSSLYKLIWRHWTYKVPVRYILSSVWVRLRIFSQLSIIQCMGLCVFSLPISPVMIESIHILRHITIIKWEVWTITHWLWLGLETMVCGAWWCHQMEHFLCYWPFLQGIHRSPVNSPHKGQWRGALMFSLICVWINCWVNNREAGDLRRYCAHYDVSVMVCLSMFLWLSFAAVQADTGDLDGVGQFYSSFSGGTNAPLNMGFDGLRAYQTLSGGTTVTSECKNRRRCKVALRQVVCSTSLMASLDVVRVGGWNSLCPKRSWDSWTLAK